MGPDIVIYRGNTDTRTITITSGGVAFDMTGYTLKFVVKKNLSDLDANALINKAVVFSVPATGIGVLSLTHTDMSIAPGKNTYELKLYDAARTLIRTLGDPGLFLIKDVVLQEV